MHLAFLLKPGSIPVIKMINYCTEINKLLLELKASKVDVSVYENAGNPAPLGGGMKA